MSGEKSKLMNGQLWRQSRFPFFNVVVIMLAHVEGELMFCRLGTGCTPPLMMTEESGKWMYTEQELHDLLAKHGYVQRGTAAVVQQDGEQVNDTVLIDAMENRLVGEVAPLLADDEMPKFRVDRLCAGLNLNAVLSDNEGYTSLRDAIEGELVTKTKHPQNGSCRKPLPSQ